MEYIDISEDIVHEDLVPAINDRFKQLLGYVNGTAPDNPQTIQELRTEILAMFSAIPYDQAGFYVGKPAAGQKLFTVRVTRAFTLPANCAGSRAGCAIAPYAATTFKITRNGYQIGTFTFSAGMLTATFTSDETEFVVGDVLNVWAPDTADVDLEDPDWNFKINLEIS